MINAEKFGFNWIFAFQINLLVRRCLNPQNEMF